MINNVPASIPKFPVAATQPNMNGIAPGNAPTKTDKGVFGFIGVYKKTYIKIEIAANIAVFGFTANKITNPIIVSTIPKIKADCVVIAPDGSGLFLVRSIKESISFSII